MHQHYQNTAEHLPSNVERFLQQLYGNSKVVPSGDNPVKKEADEEEFMDDGLNRVEGIHGQIY